MRPPGPLKRGQIILLRHGRSIYVQRIAALPGEAIALLNGRVILDGKPVPQQTVGADRVSYPNIFGPRAIRLGEHFPGEEGHHDIHDSGHTSADDFGSRQVAPGHVFVLGDNRDNSADSRVPRDEEGVEQLPVGDILGRPIGFTWLSAKFGQAIH